MNTPKKYTRDELATKLVEANMEVLNLQAKVKSLVENSAYAWRCVHSTSNKLDQMEREVYRLEDVRHTLSTQITDQESEIRRLTRWNLVHAILGWTAAGSIFALLVILFCR